MADNQYLETFLSGVKDIEAQRKEKIKKDELIQPIEFDAPVVPETIMSDSNPDVEDNKQMRIMNERWAEFAKRKHPDDAKKQVKKELEKITWNRIIQIVMILNEITNKQKLKQKTE